MPSVLIVGGHGKVAMRLARLLANKPGYHVSSIIRKPEDSNDIEDLGAVPRVMSLEDDPKEAFAEEIKGKDIVYFSAGAGGKGGPERTRKVDYEGAVKIFDAIELVQGPKPRLIMLSAIDVRDRNRVPEHYDDEDRRVSDKTWGAISVYMQAKYDADKDLSQRVAFPWTILRPSGLREDPGTGKAAVGKAHLKPISRDDVALALALLAEKPGAAGLGIDLAGGESEIGPALDAFIEKGESDFVI